MKASFITISKHVIRKIPIEKKVRLIDSVMNDHLSIHQASKLHQINYSSAKYIINRHRIKTNQLRQKMIKKSKKQQTSSIIYIDQQSGNIMLYKNTMHSCLTSSDNSQLSGQNKNLTDSYLLEIARNMKMLSPIQKQEVHTQMIIDIKFKQQLQLPYILKQLQIQHEMMLQS